MNILVMVAAASFAATDMEPAAVLELSIDDAVRMALDSSELVRAAALDIDRAEGQIAEARAVALPRVGLDLTYTKVTGSGGQFPPMEISFGPGVPAMDFGDLFPDAQYSGSLMLSQVVYQGGQVRAGLRAARISRQQAEGGLELTRVGAVYVVKLAYAEVLLRKAVLEAATEAVQLAESHLRDVRSRRAAGFVTEFEELQASVQQKNAEAQRIRARTGYQVARDGLLRRLGRDLGREVSLTDPLEDIARFDDTRLLVDFLALAGRRRLELRIAELTEQMLAVALGVSSASMRPSVAVSGGVRGVSGKDYFHEDFEWDSVFVVQASVPLFDGLAWKGKRRQARAELEQAQIRREGLESDIEREVRTAYWRVEAAREFVEGQTGNVKQALEAVRQAGLRRDSGMVTEIVRQEARTALAQARTNLAQAHFELFSSMLELERAAGLIVPPGPSR